jgi:hypothetical protein
MLIVIPSIGVTGSSSPSSMLARIGARRYHSSIASSTAPYPVADPPVHMTMTFEAH